MADVSGIAPNTTYRSLGVRPSLPTLAEPGSRAGLVAVRSFESVTTLTSVGVTLKPWHPGLPIRHLGPGITIGHLHLRQTLGVKYLVIRDEIV